jgi:hypothetical protein
MIRVMNDQKSRDRMTPGETTHFTSSEFTKEKEKHGVLRADRT